MKALRVLKWLSFVVFVLSLVLCIAGHGLVIYETNLFSDTDEHIFMKDINSALKETDAIGNLFGKDEAEAKTEDKTEGADEVSSDDASKDTSDDTAGDASLETTTTEGETGEAAAAPAEDVEKSEPSAYSTEGKNAIAVAVMKYGTMSIEINFIAKLMNAEHFEIALTMLIAYCAMFITVLLHVISKSHKTFYGLLLMIIGYLFFAVIVAAGYYFFNNYLQAYSESLLSDDWGLIRTVFIACFFILGSLIGLPIYSCGIRQMTNKRLKAVIRRLQRRNAR